MKWFKSKKGRKSDRTLLQRAAKYIRGRYDAAITTDDNRRHFANADGLDPNAAMNPSVRRHLRNRARYEVANNSYANGIVNTLANYVVGSGPRLQLLGDGNPDANSKIERLFGDWAKEIGLPAKLRTLRKARATDGEVFAVFVNNPKLRNPVKLDIRLIEADQVTTPNLSILNPNTTDGIVFDADGNPEFYHVLKAHPGGTKPIAGLGLEYDEIHADSVIHYFRADRPGQSRGVPDITPAIPLFAHLRRYTLAVIAAAETAADIVAVIHTNTPAEESADVEAMDTIELEKRMTTVLPSGWDLGQLKAEQPATTYKEFKNEILNEIARCLDMPFNVAACNSSEYNYASGRLDHQTFFKGIIVEQEHLGVVVLDRIFDAWLREAILISNHMPQSARLIDSHFPHQWFWDGYEHVDPAKEAKAQEMKLRNHTTTLADEWAKTGRDWEAKVRQRAKEIALLKNLGMTPAEALPKATGKSNAKG